MKNNNIELEVMATGGLAPSNIQEFKNLKNHIEGRYVCVPDEMYGYNKDDMHDYYLWAVITTKLTEEELSDYRAKGNAGKFRRFNDELNYFSHVYFIVSDVDDKETPIVLRYVKSTDDRFDDLRFRIVTDQDEKQNVLSTYED